MYMKWYVHPLNACYVGVPFSFQCFIFSSVRVVDHRSIPGILSDGLDVSDITSSTCFLVLSYN